MWQSPQSWTQPRATWFGLLARARSSRWQVTHSIEVGVNLPTSAPWWQREALGHRVHPDQREARARVGLDLAAGSPGGLPVAVGALASELPLVHVLVAAGAALLGEGRHRPAVVVAAQAAGPRVGPLEPHAGLGLVVELEVVAQRLPAAPRMTRVAARGEVVVGQDRAVAGPPVVALGVDAAVDRAGGDEERRGQSERRPQAVAGFRARGAGGTRCSSEAPLQMETEGQGLFLFPVVRLDVARDAPARARVVLARGAQPVL